MTESCIRIKNASKSYSKKTVLHHISLDIDQSEIFGLLGPSGAGKTTLVKLLVGLEAASEGSIEVLGSSMPDLRRMAEIGFMAQSDALYNELTADQNLEFFGNLYGWSGKRLRQRMTEVLELVDLVPHRYKAVSQFSGGMKRRLSLAASLIHQPRILVLDEPTVGIDPVLRQSIWRELQRLHENGTTIIVTTHVMDEADKCDRLAMIRDGRLIGVDTPKQLKASAGATTLEEAFLYYGGVRA